MIRNIKNGYRIKKLETDHKNNSEIISANKIICDYDLDP